MGKVIYDTRDLETASENIRKGVDKALLATAFKVRDDARANFQGSANMYKRTPNHDYNSLASGIMVGKLNNGTVKVHALGDKSNYNSYKARFFVGGTTYRQEASKNGKTYTKGFIQGNDALGRSVDNNNSTLTNYINNVIDNG